MKLKKIKIIVSLLLTLAIFTAASIPAAAVSTYTSAWRYYTGYGPYYYQYRSIYTIGSSAQSTAHIQTTDDCPMSPSYVYSNAMLYTPSGALKKSTGFQQLPYSVSSYKLHVSTTDPGTYYAQCLFQMFASLDSDGNRVYVTRASYPTASGSFTSNLNDPISESYSETATGETYGSAIAVSDNNELPDLIKAEGINGSIGYITKEDFCAHLSTDNNSAIVPVYNLEGTVIDTFEFACDEDN